MKNKLFYLAGGMQNLSLSEQNDWRIDLKDIIEDLGNDKIHVINPIDHFSFFEKTHESDREVMELDLGKVRKSDLIIVNFNDPKSIGTTAELAISYEHRIPIIGLNENNNELHPWLKCFCSRIFTDKEDLLLYVIKHYIND